MYTENKWFCKAYNLLGVPTNQFVNIRFKRLSFYTAEWILIVSAIFLFSSFISWKINHSTVIPALSFLSVITATVVVKTPHLYSYHSRIIAYTSRG